MNIMPLKKNNKNDGFISTIIMGDIIKRKKLLLFPTLLFGHNFFINNDFPDSYAPTNSDVNFVSTSIDEPNLNSSLKTVDSIQTTDSIKTIDIIQSMESFKTNDSIQTTDSIKTIDIIQSMESFKTNDSIRTTDSVQTMNSFQTTDSIQSVDSAQTFNLIESNIDLNTKINLISENIAKTNNDKSANSFIDNIIKSKKCTNVTNMYNKEIHNTDNTNDINKINNFNNINNNDINDEDSELIRDTNIVINFREKISENKHIINNGPVVKNEPIKIPNDEYIRHMSTEDFIILSNLTLLSKIKPLQKLLIEPINYKNDKHNGKLSKINFEIKIDNSYVPRLTRWYYSQGRNETIVAVNSLIDVSIEQFFLHKNYNNNINAHKYFNLLESSKIGLKNLKSTYNTDHNSSSNIENILEKINKFMEINTTENKNNI